MTLINKDGGVFTELAASTLRVDFPVKAPGERQMLYPTELRALMNLKNNENYLRVSVKDHTLGASFITDFFDGVQYASFKK